MRMFKKGMFKTSNVQKVTSYWIEKNYICGEKEEDRKWVLP